MVKERAPEMFLFDVAGESLTVEEMRERGIADITIAESLPETTLERTLKRVREEWEAPLRARIAELENRRCSSCRWWNFEDATTPNEWSMELHEDQGFGECTRLEGYWGDRDSAKMTLAEIDEVMSQYKFVPTAADSWDSCLLTSPEFGCVQWEAKDE